MMDRNREARRAAASMVASSNGISRRRHRSSNSLRDSPDEDGQVELQESVRLRERVKKDRERDRDRYRDRERDRERERSSRSSKRRRGERIMIHGSNRDDGGEDSSEESVNDEEDEDEEDTTTNINNHNGHHNSGGVGGGGGVRLLPPNPGAASVGMHSILNHYHSSNSNSHHHHNNHNSNNSNNNSTNHNHQQNHNLQHRKSFPPSATKVFRAAPVWKSSDEMIGVLVPRKARSASKRSHDWINSSAGGNSGGGGGEQIQQQTPASPVRQGLITTTSTPLPGAPLSPSSSNASLRKKIKPNGQKQPRPPKSSSKSSSSNPEELEIEIAEVLYGLMTQSQAPPKKEILSNDSREVNRSSSDAKSRVSSPISNSPSTANVQSSTSILLPNPISFSPGPLSAVAPKRKRPRQVSENPGSYSVRNSPISSTTAKLEADQTPKAEISFPSLEKVTGSAAESGYDLRNLLNSQVLQPPPPEPIKIDSEAKSVVAEELGECKDVVLPLEEVVSSKKESPAVRTEETNREDAASVTALASATKISSTFPEVDKQREEKFQIDLETPPQLRLSPERDGEICVGSAAMDLKPIVSDVDAEMKPRLAKDDKDEKMVKIGKENGVNVGADEKKVKSAVEETEETGSQKTSENKGRIIDLQLDLEKPERENGTGNKLQAGHKQQQPPVKASKEPHAEKSGQSNSLSLPMSMASWPGGLPPMGYMAPIPGVVSMDGTTVSPASIQPFFSQPRPKRCATHCYIARNIHCLQQFIKMNPFWSAAAAAAAAGSASLFGSKACNLNVVPPADLHGNIAGRGVNNAQDKGQGVAIFPGHGRKDKVSQPANIADAGQRKQQILLQQALPAVATNNILHGPAFILPLSHQQAAMAAASALPSSTKPPPTTSGSVASANTFNSAAINASATAGGPAAAVSFNYPNIPTNETQYLAILQNNAYPFPLQAVGAPSNFRGTHPHAMPLFNGSFYSSQSIHPSQLQQQQQAPASQSQQMPMPQSHQNASMSSGSSLSQKHLQSQQQQSLGTTVGGGAATGNLHNFPAPQNRPSQQSQQKKNQHISPPQGRQLENEVGSEDSPSTADSRGSRAPVNIYGKNFAMPIHPQNYALLTPPAAFASAPATSGSGNQSEKKQQQSQQLGLKNVVEPLPPQAFAMSFTSINGATAGPGIDFSSMAQNHAILQSLPEATRQNIHMTAANPAHVAQQRKNFRVSEDCKSGGRDFSNADDERKGLPGKSPATVGQSIVFSRSELADASGSPAVGNCVIDSSARSINPSSGAARTSRPTMPRSVGAAGVSSAQLQAQHQPQQVMQLHKHPQQFVSAAAAWSKNPLSSDCVYPEHLSSSSPGAAKFPTALSAFPQNLMQSSNSSSPTQSPQWKNSTRTTPSQVPSSFPSSITSSLKNLPQQHGRTQQSHSQISFGANQKSSATPPGQQPPGSNQAPASPMMVGSPSTSSISKGAGGSPRTTTSASASSKTGQASLSAQQAKNSSAAGQKSSPVGGRNVPSILGNTHIAVSSSSGPKPQMQQQQQLTKNMQQVQFFFSNPYMQSQSPNSTSTNSASSAPSGGYYGQRRRPDQQQQPQPQQPPGTSATSSAGMLSLCPVSLAGATASDPAKAIAAATAAASNTKGAGLASQSILHTAQFAAQSSGNQHQLMSTGFAYVHTVPAGVQAKPPEQKQPAGNDNLHASWQREKK